MNITRNQFEILTYIESNGGQAITKEKMAAEINFSVDCIEKELGEILSMGLITIETDGTTQITKTGLEALKPYRVKRAIIIAAGFGSRMVPITLNTPKPLVRVHGKVIIETLLDAIVEAGIPEIVIVRGYLGAQFDVLKNKYDNIKFIENPLYNDANNISSALLVKDMCENAYVMEADLLLSNPKIIRKYEYCTNYIGRYTDLTDDWCFIMKDNYIDELKVGATNCYHMYGISYWTKEDGKKLSKALEDTFKMPGGKEKYWDEAPLRVFKDEFKVEVRPCYESDIVEIDSFNELKAIDPIYAI